MRQQNSAIPSSAGGTPWAFVHLIVVYLVWGSTYLAVKIVVSGAGAISPLQLQTWRMWCAGLLLGGLALLQQGIPRGLRSSMVLLCAFTGVLMWMTGNGLATLASRHASSSFIVMVMAMIPAWTLLIECLFTRKRPSARGMTGIAFALAGIALIFSPPILSGDVTAVEPGYGGWVAAVLTAAGITWSTGTVLQRPVLKVMSPAWAASIQLTAAAIALTITDTVTGQSVLPAFDFSTAQYLAFAFLVVFGSVIALMSYLKVIESLSASKASSFAYVNPVIGIFLGWIVLSEQPGWPAMGGIALVLVGVFFILSQPRRQHP